MRAASRRSVIAASRSSRQASLSDRTASASASQPDMVLGSRILGTGALKGGMPLYKYVANRFLTAFQNLFLGVKLSEYHTGFRAFSRELLEALPILENS